MISFLAVVTGFLLYAVSPVLTIASWAFAGWYGQHERPDTGDGFMAVLFILAALGLFL